MVPIPVCYNEELENTRIARSSPLVPPDLLQAEIRLSAESRSTILRARKDAASIITGHSPRLLVICGPCAISNPYAALAYAARLRPISQALSDDLLIVMRVRMGAPLSSGPKDSLDINKHLRTTRQLFADITEAGIPICTELVDPITPRYLADLPSLSTVEEDAVAAKIYMELASGVSFPVGFVGVGKGMSRAAGVIKQAAESHCFLSVTKQGLTAITHTTGNEHGFVIQRGACEGIDNALDEKLNGGIALKVVVDCTVGRSDKSSRTEQAGRIQGLIGRVRSGDQSIIGVMLESTIHENTDGHGPPGSSGLRESVCQASSCLEWGTTVKVLEDLAAAVRERRQRQDY